MVSLIERSIMIGTLTFHFAHNYGAMLQAYALLAYLKSRGKDVEIINYCPEKMTKAYALRQKGEKPFETMKNTYICYKRRKQYYLFESFKNEVITNGSAVLDCMLPSFMERYDTIIVGSDQVWNTRMNMDDPNYFLQALGSNTNKIAYGVSIGVTRLSESLKDYLDRNIGEFNKVSFREKSAANLIKYYYHINASVVCDPVFLIDRCYWKKMMKMPASKLPSKFLLYYSLNDEDELINGTLMLAQEERIPIVAIHPVCKRVKFADYNLRDVGPREFLGLVEKAQYICTNSYHGTAFSIIFKKSGLFCKNSMSADRLIDLMGLLNIQPIISRNDNYYDFSNQRYELLEETIHNSKLFLEI